MDRNLLVPRGLPGIEDVGPFDRDRVRQPSPNVRDQVIEVDLGATWTERGRREQVALMDRRDSRLSKAAETAEDDAGSVSVVIASHGDGSPLTKAVLAAS